MGVKAITVAHLKNLMDETGGFERVLDVGCGEKIYRPFIRARDYIGIDVETSGRAMETKRADRFFNGTDIPFDNESFDFVICTEVLEHAHDPTALMREMKRVLKSGGVMLVTVPSMWGEHETPYDFRRYTSFGIKKLVAEVGLQVKKFEKESPGVLAFIKLGLSEIARGREAAWVKGLANLWLKATYLFLAKILRVQMPRIYLTNLLIARKE